jgi:hypothetical protein
MLVAAHGAADPPEPPECEQPDDAQDDNNPATRLRFSVSLRLSAFSENG